MVKEIPQIAAQLYCVQDYLGTVKEFEFALDQLHQIGYRAVQYANRGVLAGDNPELSLVRAREAFERKGLVCSSAHRPWSALRDNTDIEIERLQTLGCSYVFLNFLEQPYDMHEAESYRRFSIDSVPVIQALEDAGLQIGFHNHSHEFQRNGPDGETLFEFMVECFDERFLFEPDVYWISNGAIDPAEVLARLRGRIPCVHVKDAEVIPVEGAGAFELAVQTTYAPVGEGNLDWGAILSAGQKSGVKQWIVEQDEFRRDVFGSMESSYSFLKEKLASL